MHFLRLIMEYSATLIYNHIITNYQLIVLATIGMVAAYAIGRSDGRIIETKENKERIEQFQKSRKHVER